MFIHDNSTWLEVRIRNKNKSYMRTHRPFNLQVHIKCHTFIIVYIHGHVSQSNDGCIQ